MRGCWDERVIFLCCNCSEVIQPQSNQSVTSLFARIKSFSSLPIHLSGLPPTYTSAYASVSFPIHLFICLSTKAVYVMLKTTLLLQWHGMGTLFVCPQERYLLIELFSAGKAPSTGLLDLQKLTS